VSWRGVIARQRRRGRYARNRGRRVEAAPLTRRAGDKDGGMAMVAYVEAISSSTSSERKAQRPGLSYPLRAQNVVVC
jgi:hypothetical protein